jgi:purine-binding chemotaxis protein CheW
MLLGHLQGAPLSTTAVLLVEVGARRLALPTNRIREVANAGTVTPVPLAPPPIAGLTQVRGQILPVLELADPPRTPRPNDALVVLEDGGVRAALLVDRVLGVDRGDAQIFDVEGLFARVRATIEQRGGDG